MVESLESEIALIWARTKSISRPRPSRKRAVEYACEIQMLGGHNQFTCCRHA